MFQGHWSPNHSEAKRTHSTLFFSSFFFSPSAICCSCHHTELGIRASMSPRGEGGPFPGTGGAKNLLIVWDDGDDEVDGMM